MNAITPNTATPSVNPFGWLQREAPARYSNMGNLAQLLEQRSEQASTKVVENKQIELLAHPDPQSRDDLNQMVMRVDGTEEPIGMTHWSFGQLASLAKAPAAYLRTLPAANVAENLMYGLRHIREVENVKPYFDGAQLRAVTGPGYGRVDDFQVVEAVQSILDEDRWVAADDHMGFSVTDRTLQMFLIDRKNPVVVGRAPNGADDVMYRGIRIVNSELGYSSLSVEGFFFRSYCLNGCIFGMQEAHSITVRHSKSAPSRWAREVQPAIEAYASQDGTKLIEQVEKVKEANVAKDDDAAINFINNRGLSRSQARDVLDRIENEEGTKARSAWSIVQGITSLARETHVAEDRADLERVAGSIWVKAAA